MAPFPYTHSFSPPLSWPSSFLRILFLLNPLFLTHPPSASYSINFPPFSLFSSFSIPSSLHTLLQPPSIMTCSFLPTLLLHNPFFLTHPPSASFSRDLAPFLPVTWAFFTRPRRKLLSKKCQDPMSKAFVWTLIISLSTQYEFSLAQLAHAPTGTREHTKARAHTHARTHTRAQAHREKVIYRQRDKVAVDWIKMDKNVGWRKRRRWRRGRGGDQNKVKNRETFCVKRQHRYRDLVYEIYTVWLVSFNPRFVLPGQSVKPKKSSSSGNNLALFCPSLVFSLGEFTK